MNVYVSQTLVMMCLLVVGCKIPASMSKFDVIRQMVIEGRFEEAIPRLQSFQRSYPDSPNASRAGLFLGKAHLGLGDLEAAAKAFETTIAKYPDSLEAHKSRYKLGLIALLQDEREQAETIFDELAQERNGPLVPEAMAMSTYLRAD